MRTLHKSLAYLGILVCAAIGQLAACASYSSDCSENGICLPNGNKYLGGGEVSPECKALPSEDSSVIKDECGIFVSSSAADGGDGTKAKPFKSLQAGLDAAAKSKFRVYACAETYTEEAKASIVSVFGGFDCANGWTYVVDPAKRATIAPTDGIPLRVTGGASLQVQDVIAQAPSYDQPAATGEEAKSSIAAIVDGSTVEFARCDILGGRAQDGAPPSPPPDSTDLKGLAGNPGKDACMAGAANAGGAEQTKTCDEDGVMVTSVGGKGGNGGSVELSPFKALAGAPGASGSPDLGAGQGGQGEPESGVGWSCSDGGNGKDGLAGSDGTGPAEVAISNPVNASGYAPADGKPGNWGSRGQGGGGGGGARGGQNICGAERPGASGGSGGTGGCGGKGGEGGKGGGASVALISADATVALTDCKLEAGQGGNGGPGGQSQSGGNGGFGGKGGEGANGSKNACSGGIGGNGGRGGPGGGGAGGPSIAIAHSGKAPEKRDGTTVLPGTPGEGGLDGSGGIMSAGAEGTTGDIVSF
ncbi:hypothetical protein [Polyangium sp. 15x6]|uniref:hypothetical protein n=1 Tax=Polyangium sp. 15x6 TaxID=3042687 RepID=UPI00249B325E|nr:hypothetical protein [Polyangium sp. 15x6]MDI3285361.1 hypothetical protein [Polyangium sp. 15x6]